MRDGMALVSRIIDVGRGDNMCPSIYIIYNV